MGGRCCRCCRCWISCHLKCSTFVESRYGSNAGPRLDVERGTHLLTRQRVQRTLRTSDHDQPIARNHSASQPHVLALFDLTCESPSLCNRSFECTRCTFFCEAMQLQPGCRDQCNGERLDLFKAGFCQCTALLSFSLPPFTTALFCSTVKRSLYF